MGFLLLFYHTDEGLTQSLNYFTVFKEKFNHTANSALICRVLHQVFSELRDRWRSGSSDAMSVVEWNTWTVIGRRHSTKNTSDRIDVNVGGGGQRLLEHNFRVARHLAMIRTSSIDQTRWDLGPMYRPNQLDRLPATGDWASKLICGGFIK